MQQSARVFELLCYFVCLVEWRHQNDSETELWRHYDVIFNGNLLKYRHTRLYRVDKTTQICAAHRFLSWEQRTICTCCVLAKIAFQTMVINFKKPAYLICLIRAAPWNLLTSSWRHPLITWSPFYPYFIFSLRLLQKPYVAVIAQTIKR